MIAYRHGLRVGELVRLRWDQIDLQRGTMHVNRTKNGKAGTHPLSGRELRALRQLKRIYKDSPLVFVTERGGPITDATVREIIDRAGQVARIAFPVHPHMLRQRPASTSRTMASTPEHGALYATRSGSISHALAR